MSGAGALEAWIDAQYGRSAEQMLESVSPVRLIKERPGFGQTVRAARGAIVASPVLGAYDPDPDYFFHWYRDSAVVVDALRVLHGDGTLGAEALGHLRDFVEFSRALSGLDGRRLAAQPRWRARVAPDFVQYLRPAEELAAVHGETVGAETRVNADGSLDISRWARPQHDGPPLRALALLRWLREVPLEAALAAQAAELVRADLDFTLHRWPLSGFDIWEEETGRHYYTLRVSAAALREGAGWLAARGEPQAASACAETATRILAELDAFWLPAEGHYRSRVLASGERSAKELDISVILAPLHAGAAAGAHSVDDPRIHATLARLEALFDAAYPINRERGPACGPAMGRYAGDAYYSGGAYYFSTLGAAELCFRAGARGDVRAWRARGDAFLETVRRYTPPSGELSEQFDRRTGAQTSAKRLAWSYAGFITCIAARRALA